ncbi:MAG: GNAT family protein, partial [Pseudomonadota bacterium]
MSHTNHLGQPIGDPVPGWTPPPFPERRVLEGRYGRLEPLTVGHAGDLFEAFSADETGRNWTWRREEPFPTLAALTEWIATLEADPTRVWHAYINRKTGKALGNGALMSISPQEGSIEVGSIMFSPAMQGTRLGTEAMCLVIDYAFSLGYRRMEWTCDPLNRASMAAAARLGFRFEAHFRQAMVSKGRNRDKAVFSIIDREWPALKARAEAWLDPANFDNAGRQVARIAPLDPAPDLETPFELNPAGDPVGLPVAGWTLPPVPPRAPMEGRYCRLEPLAETHASDLFEALSADAEGRVFTYMP